MTVTPRLLERLAAIPAMSGPPVLERLHAIGAAWTGHGAAVECGSWLGASCAALASGLVEAGYDRPIYCYDRWEANPSEVEKAARLGLALHPGEDLEPHFRRHVETFYSELRTTRGSIRHAIWDSGPIEIFLLDAAKREPDFGDTLRSFGPSWIPGVTVVGLLDFYFYRKKQGPEREEFRCQKRFVERHADSLVPLDEVGSVAFFRYARRIPWEQMEQPAPRRGRLARWLRPWRLGRRRAAPGSQARPTSTTM